MRRRDLLKGLVALPAVAAVGLLPEDCSEGPVAVPALMQKIEHLEQIAYHEVPACAYRRIVIENDEPRLEVSGGDGVWIDWAKSRGLKHEPKSFTKLWTTKPDRSARIWGITA